MMKMRRGNKILCILTAVCLMVTTILSGCPEEIYGADSSQARYLESITVNATVKSRYSDDGKYDKGLYDQIMGKEYNKLYTSETDALKISSAEELAAFARAVNEGKSFEGKYVKLKDDIDAINLEGMAPKIERTEGSASDKFEIVIDNPDGYPDGLTNVWVPIGTEGNPFSGTFDGNGKIIEGMVVCEKGTDSQYAGLFGNTTGSTIKNLGIEGAYVIANSKGSNANAGSLIGKSGDEDNITSCYGSGAVYAFSAFKSESESVSAIAAAGGLVGYDGNDDVNYQKKRGWITNCYGSGAAYAFSAGKTGSAIAYAGGLVGWSRSNITNCYGSGAAYASNDKNAMAGSLGGWTFPGIIKDCYRNRDAEVTAKQGESAGTIAGDAPYRTRQEMTGIGPGRADEMMEGFDPSVWIFTPDRDTNAAIGERIGYFPRLAAINYLSGTEPSYQKTDTLKPEITSDLSAQGATYVKGDRAEALTLAAQATDSGKLNYQWYQSDTNATNGGTELIKEKGQSYTPPTDTVGTQYYYCVVTNQKDSATGAKTAVSTSKAAKITIHAHNWKADWSSDGTHHWHDCKTAGCPISGNSKKNGYAAHSWDAGKVTKKPTYISTGVKTTTCTVCKKAKTKILPKLSLAAPKVKTSTTYKSVKLSWKAVKGVKGYQIYRASKKNGKYKKVKTTKAKSWTDKKLTTGKTYYYKVRAYEKEGRKTVYGSFSKKVKAVPRTKAPKFTLKSGRRSIKVVWKKVEGAHGYRIYRARSKGGKYKMLKDSRAYTPGYTSIGITANHKYYYKLRSYRIVKGKKVYSSYTKVKTVKTK